jgi:hypothetical protein
MAFVDLPTVIETLKVAPIELRDYVRKLDLENISSWIKTCQASAGQGIKANYGLVHQDLVNVLGEKLGFQVEFGDYGSGPDGIWKFEQAKIIIESKTSPTWLKLNQVNDYIIESAATCGVAVASDFEQDQIKAVPGYRIIRLISTAGLIRLVEMKEKGLLLPKDIVNFLVPQETWVLDSLVDLVYQVQVPIGELEKSRLNAFVELCREYRLALDALKEKHTEIEHIDAMFGKPNGHTGLESWIEVSKNSLKNPPKKPKNLEIFISEDSELKNVRIQTTLLPTSKQEEQKLYETASKYKLNVDPFGQKKRILKLLNFEQLITPEPNVTLIISELESFINFLKETYS